jgi:GDSL-like Lipase/Acylhydrolase family
LSLLSLIIALGALIVGVYGSGAFDQYGGKKQIIATIVIHALPAITLTIPVLLLRVYGLWFGIFLISQYLLSPPLLGDARHYMTLRPNMNRTVDVVGDAIPGIQGIQRITTDVMGFRVRPPVDYEHKRGFRIFAIGASTTEQIALDDRSTWTYLLQEKLAAETGRPVEVINTGLAGTRALHHVVMLRHILDYSPDCAMFLIGVNDWNKHIREHFGSDYYRREEDEGRLFTRTLLGRALLAGVTRWRARDLDGSAQVEDGTYFSSQNDSLARADVRTLVLDDVAPDYRAQLEEIGATCRATGVPCVFLTQPSGYSPATDPRYRRYFWMTPLNENYTLDLASMAGIADLYNQHLIRFARGQAHDVIDLAAAIPAGTGSFYDDVHFNAEGALRVANVLAKELIAGTCGFAD